MKDKKEIQISVCKKNKKTPVICLETGVVYVSARDAERKTGIWATSILNCCDGKKTQASGKKWKYA